MTKDKRVDNWLHCILSDINSLSKNTFSSPYDRERGKMDFRLLRLGIQGLGRALK